jgi:hypothetical protein
MNTRVHLSMIVAAGCFGFAAASASAGIVTFEFSEVDGGYDGDASSGTFTAVVGQNTQGDVTSIGDGTATFLPGMSGPEDVFFSIDRNGDSGTGTWAITDASDEKLQGELSGTWSDIGDFLVFSGALTGSFDDPGGFFDGSNFADGFTQLGGTLSGAVTILVAADDFSGDFSGAVTLVQGILVPTPGAIGLLGLAGLVASRRRR